MSLNPGDQISYRLMPAVSRYRATVQSADEHNLVLRLAADSPAVINRGQCVMITEPDTDIEHYSEVMSGDETDPRAEKALDRQARLFPC